MPWRSRRARRRAVTTPPVKPIAQPRDTWRSTASRTLSSSASSALPRAGIGRAERRRTDDRDAAVGADVARSLEPGLGFARFAADPRALALACDLLGVRRSRSMYSGSPGASPSRSSSRARRVPAGDLRSARTVPARLENARARHRRPRRAHECPRSPAPRPVRVASARVRAPLPRSRRRPCPSPSREPRAGGDRDGGHVGGNRSERSAYTGR